MTHRSALALLNILLTVSLWFPLLPPAARGDSLEKGFANPPESTKPWCYWYWISDNISREGITRDLEAMKRVGIGEAFIGNIYLEDVKIGKVKALTEEWWALVEHAIREGGRLGVNVGLFNCPGWSQSGGPWIKPGQAMRYVAMSEARVKGPTRFTGKIAPPREPFQDVCVLAFPAPANDADLLRPTRVATQPETADAANAADGKSDTVLSFPAGAGQGKKTFSIDLESTAPFTARSVIVRPAHTDFAAKCELLVSGKDGEFRSVRSFPIDRSNNSVGVGFVPYAPVSISFPAVTGRKFRLAFTSVRSQAGIAEIELSGAARVERFMEKQLAKMHPTPLPLYDAYLWPSTAPADDPALSIASAQVQDVSACMKADGTLSWDVPAGEWIIQRLGMTPTGTKNSPASPEGQGLEVDKMNARAAQDHFDAFIGKLLARFPSKSDRKAFRRVIADSYEMGSQNWTDGLREVFEAKFGYDPQPFLPVLSGRVVGSADESDRFLWDLRRMVADQVSYGYVGGLRKACHQEGLLLWLENYGHWGFPGEFLQYGGQSDQVSGEFWATGDLGSIELRAASSAAHIYGKRVVSAEAFTSTQKFESTPWSLKKRGDWALTEGINHWVLHVNIHQPREDWLPGMNAWFSTEFNRHNTWFEQSRDWIDYYRRCQFLLQQGHHVADVAYFIGEDTPKMTGIRKPELPAGYDYDYINAEVIEKRLKVKDGHWVLPDGMSYRLLVLPPSETMRPALLRKISRLVQEGGALLGNPPVRSPSRQNYPACDAEVRDLAATLWPAKAGAADSREFTHHRVGKGDVFQSAELKPVLETLKTPPDVAAINPRKIIWTHRSDRGTDIYFLSNQSETPETIAPEFRVKDRQPELWGPVAGTRRWAAAFQTSETATRVPMTLEPRGSGFVVFRERTGRQPVIHEIRCDGKPILSASTSGTVTEADHGSSPESFTIVAWVKPVGNIGLPSEADSGVQLQQARNEIVSPPHGDTLYPQGGHAGAGISVGRNGVVVYEHSGNYYAPILTHPANLSDWTHVAVVYRSNQPSLFLNGKPARVGLPSRYQVHSGLGSGASANPGFKGEFAALQGFPGALAEAELLELARARPASATACPLPTVYLSGGKQGVQAEFGTAARYSVRWSNGRESEVTVGALPPTSVIPGPWRLEFPPGRDVPRQVVLPELLPLNQHRDEAIRHFSGTVTYRRTLEVTRDRLEGNRALWLDLGQVESIAEVTLNGRKLATLWKPPCVLDVTLVAKPGANLLEVSVTGTWRNRLVGDAKFPKGFDAKTPEFKPWLSADLRISPDEELSAFGLIGPVRLHSTQRVLLPVTP